jgi:hypothetical protein
MCKKNKQLDVCTSFHTSPIQMCNKHTWWKEVGPCMSSYLDVAGSIHAWLVLFKSFIPWMIWVWKINVAFTMLTFTIPIGWYSLACCYIVLCFLILLKLFFSLKFFVFFFHFLNHSLVGVLLVRVALVLKVLVGLTIPQPFHNKVSSCNNGVFPNGLYLPSLWSLVSFTIVLFLLHSWFCHNWWIHLSTFLGL